MESKRRNGKLASDWFPLLLSSIEETIDLGWALLSLLPVSELDRIDEDMLNKYYDAEKALQMFK